MREVIVYETNGKRFDKKEEAIAYENLCKKVKGIISQLLPRTKEIEDALDYNKHNLNILKGCFNAFCDVCITTIPSYLDWFQDVKEGKRHMSHMGRILSDHSSDYPILWSAYCRFLCIDFENGFEFQQPFYVSHQDEFFENMKKRLKMIHNENN